MATAFSVTALPKHIADEYNRLPCEIPGPLRVGVLKAPFRRLPDALLIYDKSRCVTAVNSSGGHILGRTVQNLVGKQCKAVFRCAMCDPNCAVSMGLESGSAEGAVQLRAPAGKSRTFVVRTVQLNDNDEQFKSILAVLKLTSREVEAKPRRLVVQSPEMRDIMESVRPIAASDANAVLLEGEKGTGKGLIAGAIHYYSSQQPQRFLAISCAEVPGVLLERELFGSEKELYAVARTAKRGLVELADRGTLLVDEITSMPLSLQEKLLGVLKGQPFRRCGGITAVRSDLRVIAATTHNLDEAVEQGCFNRELYGRLKAVRFLIPPLRQRREDILPLAQYFTNEHAREFRQRIEGFTEEAERLLLAQDWPGNVRELKSVIEGALLLEPSPLVTASSLAAFMRSI